MQKALRYGRGSVVVDLPAETCRAVVQPKLPPAIADLDAVVARCVEDPAGGERLSKILPDRRNIVVVIPDATRGEAVPASLGALLRFIERSGIERERVTILTATGAHRPHDDSERAALVGSEVAAAWRVVDHDPDGGNVALEPLDADTPLLVDARAVEADCLLLAGTIRYHYCAGYGGGRKLVAPGLCGRETVRALHRRTLENIAPDGRWQSRTGNMQDNPFHAVLRAAAERVGPHFALNVAVGWQGQIVGVAAGDPFQSHRIACLEYDQTFRVPVARRVPLVIASCGGRPYDVNLYQAHKALDNAFRIVERDGTIVLLAECAGGWGPESFVKWLSIESLPEHHERLNDRFEIAGHTTYALKWKATCCRILLVSGVLAERVAAGEGPSWMAAAGDAPFRLEVVADLGEALERAGAPGAAAYCLLPVAASCLPEVAK